MRKRFWPYLIVLLTVISCSPSPQKEREGNVTMASVREAFQNLSTLPIAEEIESVEYLPLEITDNDESLIDGIVDYAVTSKYIYVLVGKEPRIVLFDRQGKFVRTFLRQGQGPNDFRGMISSLQVDEKKDNLYVIGSKIGVYSLDGVFKKDISFNRTFIYAHYLDSNYIAAIGTPFIPFKDGLGIGVFNEKGDSIVSKNNFYSDLVPKDISGFTFGIAASPSDNFRSVLFKMAANDTIFRLSAEGISPELICNLNNSKEEIIRGLNIRKVTKLPSSYDIFVSDMFETNKHYYLRLMKDEKYYVASIDKKNGKTIVEQCINPIDDIYTLADVNIQLGLTGSRGWRSFPIWGRMLRENNTLVQVITPYELDVYQSSGEIRIPDNLINKIKGDNPIFIFYKLKN